MKDSTIGMFCLKKKFRCFLITETNFSVLPFNFSNKGHVYFKNCTINIIGRVSMDLITIDLTNISCNLNDWVTIWGGSTEDSRLEIVASFHKNIPYTYLTGVTNRVLREYVYE